MSGRILAKSDGETLAAHTINCIKVAEVILCYLPFEEKQGEEIRRDLILAAALHDTGKAASGFQVALKDHSKPWGKRHEVLSAAFASAANTREEVCFAVLTHHKSITQGESSSLPLAQIPFPNDLNYVWRIMAREWELNSESFIKEWKEIAQFTGRRDFYGFRGLTPLNLSRKWISSISQIPDIPYTKRWYASLLRGLLVTCDHIASAGGLDRFTPVKVPDLRSTDYSRYNLYGFQKRAGEYTGNLILRAPTGSGKTLAALLWAGRNQRRNGRLFYVLPNQASINAMYLRLREHLGADCVGLLHSRAASSIYTMLEKGEDPESRIDHQKAARAAKDLAREMWFPVRVCTPHQVLRYMLHGKGWELMLSEFPRSLFIFDEVHAYDPTIIGLTAATAKYLQKLGVSCLFLSATLPRFLRTILEKEVPEVGFIEPSLDDESDRVILNKKRHNLNFIDGNVLDNIEDVAASAEKASSTLVVCNHVPTAQKVYGRIQQLLGGDVRLLHSRFNREDRNRKEFDLRYLPKVLVSTQVVEVSLDIDFEQAFLEPAPIDALIQRLGRVNRQGSRPPAHVSIFSQQVMERYPIYSPELVESSVRELSMLSNPVGEIDLVAAADRVYKSGYTGDALHRFNEAAKHPLIVNPEGSWIAGAHKDWVEELIEEKEGTLEVLPEELVGEYERREAEGLTLEADMLKVPIRRGSMSYLHDYICKPKYSSEPWVIKKPYSPERGLILSGNEE